MSTIIKPQFLSLLSAGEIEMIERVHSYFPNNEPDKFHLFYRTASPFSNFHRCSFEKDGITFDNSEKYMMYRKAKLFKNETIAEQILQASTPTECKRFGRLVTGFDDAVWKENRTPIVFEALTAKFTQDPRMKAALHKQAGHLLVEAAADDTVWGVGLDENDPLIQNRSNWKGLNLLGYILTDILQKQMEP